MSDEFTRYLRSKGTEHCTTMHDTPEHNSMAEQLNWSLLEYVQAMISVADLLKSQWDEVIMHVV